MKIYYPDFSDTYRYMPTTHRPYDEIVSVEVDEILYEKSGNPVYVEYGEAFCYECGGGDKLHRHHKYVRDNYEDALNLLHQLNKERVDKGMHKKYKKYNSLWELYFNWSK